MGYPPHQIGDVSIAAVGFCAVDNLQLVDFSTANFSRSLAQDVLPYGAAVCAQKPGWEEVNPT